MGGLSLTLLLAMFVGSGVVTWMAGVALTKATDSLDTRFRIGDAIGGLVLLGIAGSLPEIAVVGSAAKNGHMPVIIGTLIGGLSIQTLLLGSPPVSLHSIARWPAPMQCYLPARNMRMVSLEPSRMRSTGW